MGCMLLALLAGSGAALGDLKALFSDLKEADGIKFGIKDDQGKQMACVHVYEAITEPIRSSFGNYFALYHASVDGEFEVRLASSSDLMSWKFVRSLLLNADMPQVYRVSGSDWMLLVHEQWMNKGSQLPSQLGFKLYYNESDLFAGAHFNSHVSALSVGSHSQLEGTPSIYNAKLVQRKGYYMVDADIGFHFNNEAGVDQVAQGRLTSFGPTVVQPSWSAEEATSYNVAFKSLGAIGNIGQRESGILLGQHFLTQEANVGHMPPTIWQDWRVWLYYFADSETSFPTSGGGSKILELNVTTPGGSTAFGNPSWQVVKCPKDDGAKCLVVSYFLFGEGAAPGESGPCMFYKRLLPALRHIVV